MFHRCGFECHIAFTWAGECQNLIKPISPFVSCLYFLWAQNLRRASFQSLVFSVFTGVMVCPRCSTRCSPNLPTEVTVLSVFQQRWFLRCQSIESSGCAICSDRVLTRRFSFVKDSPVCSLMLVRIGSGGTIKSPEREVRKRLWSVSEKGYLTKL